MGCRDGNLLKRRVTVGLFYKIGKQGAGVGWNQERFLAEHMRFLS